MRSTRSNSVSALALATLLLIVLATPATAQNLLSNPDFDVNDLDWYHDTSSGQQWSADDADQCANSGSLTAMSVTTSPDFQAFSTRPTDCVAVTPGETLYASLRYRVGAQFLRVYFTYCSDAGCSSCGTFSPFIDFGPTSASWVEVGGASTIPASSVAAVYLTIDAALASATPFSVDLDRVYLGRIDWIASDDFELGSLCRWSVHP